MATPKQIAFRKRLLEELKLPVTSAESLDFEQMPTKAASEKLDELIRMRDERKGP